MIDLFEENCGKFSADTKIPLLNGTEKSFLEINEIFKKENVWVYSYDKSGRIVPSLVKDCIITKNNKQFLKITLDNDKEIKCAENSFFLMRNAEYKETKYLEINNSLMPLYRKKSNQKGMVGYELLYLPSTKKWKYTHRIVAAYMEPSGRYEAEVIHHKDFNKLNNNPENLEKMSWEDHTELHKKYTKLLNEYAKSEAGRSKSSELMTKLWQNTEWREKSIKRNAENLKKGKEKLIAEKRCGFQAADKEKLKEWSRETAKKQKGKKRSTEFGAKISKTRKEKYITDEKYRDSVKNNAIKNLSEYNKKISEGIIKPTEKQINARKINGKMNGRKSAYSRFYKDKFDTFEEYLSFKYPGEFPNNHKILKIEKCELEKCELEEYIYSLILDKHDNFAIEAGVFVKI